VFDQTDITVCA